MSSMVDQLGIDQSQQKEHNTPPTPRRTSSKGYKKKIYIDPECTVEDVTDAPSNAQEEEGYDADIENQLNYEVEEPVSDSDNDDSRMLMAAPSEEPVPVQASLIRGFRNLQCAPSVLQAGDMGAATRDRHDSVSSTPHKRSHSEGDLTDTDEDYHYFEREGSAATERPYLRRRLDDSPVARSDGEFDMDVDDPSELESISTNA